MKTYRLYWGGGSTEIVRGESISRAVSNAGYGQGAIRALDVWSEGEAPQYEWDADERRWRSVEVMAMLAKAKSECPVK